MSEATEQKFTHEYTRQCMIEWADHQLRVGRLPTSAEEPYLSYAVSKGWVSKDLSRVLAAGFTVAASQLKR